MYACMTPVGFDTSDKFENHWIRIFRKSSYDIKKLIMTQKLKPRTDRLKFTKIGHVDTGQGNYLLT